MDTIDPYDSIYNDPEKFGLEIVTEMGEYGYDWSCFVVWRKLDDNSLWWDEDSGCSCNGPWDCVQTIEYLRPLNSKTWSEFNASVLAFSDYYATAVEKVKLISEVSALVSR